MNERLVKITIGTMREFITSECVQKSYNLLTRVNCSDCVCLEEAFINVCQLPSPLSSPMLVLGFT